MKKGMPIVLLMCGPLFPIFEPGALRQALGDLPPQACSDQRSARISPDRSWSRKARWGWKK